MIRASAVPMLLLLAATAARAEIRRDPNGVNVNANGATTVFISYGGLDDQVPVEAAWCGEIVPAAPDRGFKCDPATIFGRLPLRYDQSRLTGTAFTDVMSIPPSVARRAYQAARRGARSDFFYVRRFVSRSGAPDEYVFVTCRMAGGGARVPFSLLDVGLSFANGENVLSIAPGAAPPALSAEILYNGSGRLKGRWEVVVPGEDLPTTRDLLTEGSLPLPERPLQRRYSQLQRFNVFLAPTGRHTLRGPDPSRLPNVAEGLYMVLLRVEATDDKEGDSSLDLAGAGQGLVHSGAAAGFPMPVLRYFVGTGTPAPELSLGGPQALLPAEGASAPPGRPVDFSWREVGPVLAYRLEVEGAQGKPLFSAIVPPGVGAYQAPPWLAERADDDGHVRWRVVTLGPDGTAASETPWRGLKLLRP